MTETIRPAESADLDRLVEIETAAFRQPDYEPMTRRQFRRHVDNPRAVLLIGTIGAGVAGYALGFTRSTSRYLRFYSLAVSPAAQGGTLGRALFEGMETAARDRGLGVITEVRADNRKLHERYLSLGYREFEMKPGYYPDGCAAIRMKRPYGTT